MNLMALTDTNTIDMPFVYFSPSLCNILLALVAVSLSVSFGCLFIVASDLAEKRYAIALAAMVRLAWVATAASTIHVGTPPSAEAVGKTGMSGNAVTRYDDEGQVRTREEGADL